MKRATVLIVVVLALAVAGTTFAGDTKHCSADPQECLAKMHQKMQHKGWLGVEFKTTDDGYWEITRVVDGSPAQEAGFQEGDVVVVFAGAKLGEKDAKIKVKNAGPGETATYVVKRNGQKVELKATLAHVPDTVMAQWIGEHMMNHHLPNKVASTKN